MKFLLSLIIITGISNKLSGQDILIDSLKHKLILLNDDSNKVNALITVGSWYTYLYPDTSLLYFQQSLRISKKINYQHGEFISLIRFGEDLAIEGNYSRALELELKALHIAEEANDVRLIYNCYMYIGNIYYYQGNYAHALDYYSKVSYPKEYPFSYEEILAACKGRTFFALGQLDSALIYSVKADKLESRNNKLTWTVPSITIAEVLTNKGYLDSALAIYRKDLEYLPGSKANLELNIPMAKLFLQKKQADSAIYYFKKTIKEAEGRSFINEADEASRLLSEIYAAEKNEDSAYKYMQVNLALKDSLFKFDKQWEIQNEVYAEKSYQQETETAIQEHQKKIRVYIFSISFTCLLAIAFILWRNNINRQKAFVVLEKLKQHEKINMQKELSISLLTAIKTQMNPHFIFNALNTIQSFVYADDKKMASNYLGKFSDLIRKILDNSARQEATLYEEIELLELYLEIEKARLGNELHIDLNVEADLETKNIIIPTMLLQPYIENAIKHGLFHKKNDKQLFIAIKKSETYNNYIQIIIDDNGIGRKSSAQLNKQRKNHKSFANTANERRLELINQTMDKKIIVNIEDKYNSFEQPQGTLVTILIPVQAEA